MVLDLLARAVVLVAELLLVPCIGRDAVAHIPPIEHAALVAGGGRQDSSRIAALIGAHDVIGRVTQRIGDAHLLDVSSRRVQRSFSLCRYSTVERKACHASLNVTTAEHTAFVEKLRP